jgi:hypothetical protein
MRRILALATAIFIIAVALGCSHSRSDGEIATDVQNKINSDPALQGKTVTAASNNGVVTLLGSADSDFERMAAGNDAAAIDGVKTVVNDIEVKPATPTAINQPPTSVRQGSKSSSRHPRFVSPASSSGRTVTIPQGTTLAVRLIDELDSDRNKEGDTFRATLDSAILLAGQVVIPRDADVEGTVISAKGGAHFAGQSALTVALTRLTAGTRTYELETDEYSRQGAARGKRTAEMIGGGAGVGALIGGLTGGGKGALIGAAAGAGAGTGVQALTHGQQVRMPSETVLQFRLKAPLTVEPSSADRNASRARVGF